MYALLDLPNIVRLDSILNTHGRLRKAVRRLVKQTSVKHLNKQRITEH